MYSVRSQKNDLIYSINQSILPAASKYSDMKSDLRKRKVLNQISLLKVNSSFKPGDLGIFENRPSISDFTPGHSKGISSIRLPPIGLFERESIDCQSPLPPLSLIKIDSDSALIRKSKKKEITKNLTMDKEIINCVSRCSYKTRTGSMLKINKAQNQDSFIISANLQGVKGQYLFAVCDGHGDQGHFVSRMIKSKLPSIVEKTLDLSKKTKNFYSQVLTESIQEVNDYILESEIETDLSGSTLISTLIIGDVLVCGNVGDSRAVLASLNNNE